MLLARVIGLRIHFFSIECDWMSGILLLRCIEFGCVVIWAFDYLLCSRTLYIETRRTVMDLFFMELSPCNQFRLGSAEKYQDL
uniref:Putative type II peptidyl carrier protein (PCP) SpiN n=1 Tax=Pseudomonas sp. Q71576 TaxID=1231908 RepID=V5IZL1_9PSED|nr:putative type II peptidyl carrier protein (PCP) SpiN [Pseudomonas sp. Q71576]